MKFSKLFRNAEIKGLICRPQFQSMINERVATIQCWPYEYISNSNIGKFHLWSDNAHLNRDGTICLGDKYLGILNKSSNLGDIS